MLQYERAMRLIFLAEALVITAIEMANHPLFPAPSEVSFVGFLWQLSNLWGYPLRFCFVGMNGSMFPSTFFFMQSYCDIRDFFHISKNLYKLLRHSDVILCK